MKVFRDMTLAILVGIVGGFLVSVGSYYNEHKEGGAKQTLLAVIDSFEKVSGAYAQEDGSSLYSQLQEYDIENAVIDTLEQVEQGEEVVVGDVLAQVFKDLGAAGDGDDILVMDELDDVIEGGELYTGIMRFHVRANSDTDEDQALKMAVKEDVLTMLKPLLADCESVEESKTVLIQNIQTIYERAIDTIVEQGYDYSVRVYITKEEFPAKTYGDLTFPAGDYQALRIDIGEAKGQNWWCVMYPPLCFVDESTAIISEDGKEVLRENLTEEEYEALFASKDSIEGQSLLYNWLKELGEKYSLFQ